MNLQQEFLRISQAAYPELIKADIQDDYQQEAKNEANSDKNQEAIDKICTDNYELDSLLVEFAIDENGEGFRNIVKMALNSNDHTEIGRIFQQMIASGFESYRSLVGDE